MRRPMRILRAFADDFQPFADELRLNRQSREEGQGRILSADNQTEFLRSRTTGVER